ncbi:MAG TPA: acyltransferase family protein, partial [Oleiagrimonas sp.]|nr:acyltransferase family protein [Oleiagrimonas sp.]
MDPAEADARRTAAETENAVNPVQTEYRLGYRPDVEGLRAIAILLVVAAHAGVHLLRGGFVGVDVFYILSGYLITGLLVQEAATTGHLRFANFYARRLRRLLPALLLMIAVACVVANLVVPPTELPRQASNASSAALWLSNFQFAYWNWDYFAPSSHTALFLHTWSLGVEEQFYLVWPLLVVLVMGAWKFAKRPPKVARLKWLFVGIFAASFALSLYWSYHRPMFAFYLMPTRAWQFALGAIVFLTVGSPAFRVRSAFADSVWWQVAGWTGLAMILYSAWAINPAAPYPGTWALLPSFGAAFVLASGAFGTGFGVRRILSLRPMQALGRVSYSWYLWHWPVLLLGATLLDMRSGWNRLLLVAISLVIAALSFHFFETPIRHRKRLVARPRWAIAGALTIMLLFVGGLRAWQGETTRYAHGPEMAPYMAALADRSTEATKCFVPSTSFTVRVCTLGTPDAAHTAVLFGDSKAAHWLPAYRRIFKAPDWRLLLVWKSGCPVTDAPLVDRSRRRTYTECEHWRDAATRKLAAMHPDVLILSESITYPFTQQQWESDTGKEIAHLADGADRIYMMLPTPELAFNGALCAQPRGELYAALASASHCTQPVHSARFDHVSSWLRHAASGFPNVRMIDMTSSVCPDSLCRSRLDGMLVFSDNGHMTATFARTL